MLTVYVYDRCSTCRKARQWLDARGLAYEAKPIRETPPSPVELHAMLAAYDGNIKRLLNTSSADYRESGLKGAIPNLSPDAVFARLQDNGNLVKRPFVIGDGVFLSGFKEPEWAEKLGA